MKFFKYFKTNTEKSNYYFNENNSFNSIEIENIEQISNDQDLIDEKILFQTMKFMLKNTDQDDPELIKFVRSLIQTPSKLNQLNLNNKNKTDFSQIGQSKYIDSILNSKDSV